MSETTHGFGAIFNFKTIGIGSMMRAKREISSLNRATDTALSEMQSKMTKFAGITAVGAGAMLIGGAGLKIIDEAINKYSDIEGLMVQLKSKTGLASKEFIKLADQVNALGRATKYTGKQVWETSNIMVGFGWDDKKLKAGLKSVLDLATAVNDVPDTAGQVLASMGNVFSKMKTSDLANQIAVAKNQTAIGATQGIKELLYLTKSVSAFKGGLAIASNEAMAFFNIFRKSGFSDASSGEYMKGLGLEMMDFATNAKKANILKAVGKKFNIDVQFTNKDGTRKSYIETFKTLYTVMGKLKNSSAEGMKAYNKLISVIFKRRQARAGFMAVVSQLESQKGLKSLDDMIIKLSIGKTMWANDKLVKAMLNTLQGRKDLAKGLMAFIFEFTGSIMMSPLKKFWGFIVNTLHEVADWMIDHKELAGKFIKIFAIASVVLFVGGAILTLVGTLGMLSSALVSMGGVMAIVKMGMLALGKGMVTLVIVTAALYGLYWLWSNWDKLGPTLQAAIIGIASALSVLAVAIGIVKVATWAMNAAWLANPITWIVLAVVVAVGLLVAAGYWLYKNWYSIIDSLRKKWEIFKAYLVVFWDVVKAPAILAFNWVKSKLDSVIGWVANAVKMLPDWLVSDNMKTWAINFKSEQPKNNDYGYSKLVSNTASDIGRAKAAQLNYEQPKNAVSTYNNNSQDNNIISPHRSSNLSDARTVHEGGGIVNKKEFVFKTEVNVHGKNISKEEKESIKREIEESHNNSIRLAMEQG